MLRIGAGNLEIHAYMQLTGAKPSISLFADKQMKNKNIKLKTHGLPPTQRFV
jgi:hypothetical protein